MLPVAFARSFFARPLSPHHRKTGWVIYKQSASVTKHPTPGLTAALSCIFVERERLLRHNFRAQSGTIVACYAVQTGSAAGAISHGLGRTQL
jgi:hypothetical protein